MNIKQQVALWLSVTMFIVAVLCAVNAWGALAVAFLAFGVISGIATWTLGLTVRSDATTEEWMNAIR